MPEYWRLHGNKLLLGLIAILLIIIVMRSRLSESALRDVRSKEALTTAEVEIAHLRETPFWMYSAESIGVLRSQHAGDAEEAIDETLKTSDDANVRARAYVDRGDLNFLLAGFPVLAPTTRPAPAAPRTSEEYLGASEAAYNEVLKDPLSKNRQAVWNARLGLAAVGENKSDWASAKSNYEAVINDGDAPQAIKTYAKQRQDALADLMKRPFIGTSATRPASNFLGPALPTTGPSTTPVSGSTPTTRPAK